MPGPWVSADQGRRFRAAAINLRQRPITPAAQLMLDALDDLAGGGAPRAPEIRATPDVGQQLRELELLADLAHASRAVTAMAIGLAVAGIGCAGAVLWMVVAP
jgi:hypothetical protein